MRVEHCDKHTDLQTPYMPAIMAMLVVLHVVFYPYMVAHMLVIAFGLYTTTKIHFSDNVKHIAAPMRITSCIALILLFLQILKESGSALSYAVNTGFWSETVFLLLASLFFYNSGMAIGKSLQDVPRVAQLRIFPSSINGSVSLNKIMSLLLTVIVGIAAVESGMWWMAVLLGFTNVIASGVVVYELFHESGDSKYKRCFIATTTLNAIMSIIVMIPFLAHASLHPLDVCGSPLFTPVAEFTSHIYTSMTLFVSSMINSYVVYVILLQSKNRSRDYQFVSLKVDDDE